MRQGIEPGRPRLVLPDDRDFLQGEDIGLLGLDERRDVVEIEEVALPVRGKLFPLAVAPFAPFDVVRHHAQR